MRSSAAVRTSIERKFSEPFDLRLHGRADEGERAYSRRGGIFETKCDVLTTAEPLLGGLGSE